MAPGDTAWVGCTAGIAAATGVGSSVAVGDRVGVCVGVLVAVAVSVMTRVASRVGWAADVAAGRSNEVELSASADRELAAAIAAEVLGGSSSADRFASPQPLRLKGTIRINSVRYLIFQAKI